MFLFFGDHDIFSSACLNISGIFLFKTVHHLFEKGARFPHNYIKT